MTVQRLARRRAVSSIPPPRARSRVAAGGDAGAGWCAALTARIGREDLIWEVEPAGVAALTAAAGDREKVHYRIRVLQSAALFRAADSEPERLTRVIGTEAHGRDPARPADRSRVAEQ